MATISFINSKGCCGPKIELGFHFGTTGAMTDFFTFLCSKKSASGSKRVLDKSFKLK